MENTQTYSKYLDPHFTLEQRLVVAFRELRVPDEERLAVLALIEPLRSKSPITHIHYEHSLRVGLLCRRIARFMHLDEKALCYAGLMHDVGKCQTDLATLGRTDGWTAADAEEIKKHVMDGYRIIRGRFDFTAEVIVFHQRFQEAGYPDELPPPLHEYSDETKAMIVVYGRLLALADVFDALHRINNKFGALTGEEIKEKMLTLGVNKKAKSPFKQLVIDLYDAEIFTTWLVTDNQTAPEADDHDRLYDQVWKHTPTLRTPRETSRHIMLAGALEPLPDKSGCTTRWSNANAWQKLGFFITGAINIGEAFEALGYAILAEIDNQPLVIYHHALQAQQESKRNRRGGRVNQGIIELLTPIVTAQYLYDPTCTLSVEEILDHATGVLKNTGLEDVGFLRDTKRFALDLSGYYERVVPDYPEAANVYDYYRHDLTASTTATGRAHNSEFVNGFPTVRAVCKAFAESSTPNFDNRVAEAYQQAALQHDPNVASGFLADCIAVMLYLDPA